VDRIYREALSLLPGDHEQAFRMLSRLLDIDDNLYEVYNLEACLQGMHGDFHAMRKGLEKCVAIAPKDPIVTQNYSKVLLMNPTGGQGKSSS